MFSKTNCNWEGSLIKYWCTVDTGCYVQIIKAKIQSPPVGLQESNENFINSIKFFFYQFASDIIDEIYSRVIFSLELLLHITTVCKEYVYARMHLPSKECLHIWRIQEAVFYYCFALWSDLECLDELCKHSPSHSTQSCRDLSSPSNSSKYQESSPDRRMKRSPPPASPSLSSSSSSSSPGSSWSSLVLSSFIVVQTVGCPLGFW